MGLVRTELARAAARIAAVVCVASMYFAAPAVGTPGQPEHEGAASRIDASERSRLDRGLHRILDSALPMAVAEEIGFRVLDDRVQVVVVSHGARISGLVAWLEERGAHRVSTARDLVQAHVDLATLAELDVHPAVRWVRPPRYPEYPDTQKISDTGRSLEKTNTTQALPALNGIEWQTAGYSGEGLKVGVIDGGFKGYAALVGTELPESSRVHFRAFGASGPSPDDPHGTACAEVIHDIAPDAELYLAQIETLVDIVNAMEWLRDQGVQVVSFSMAILFLGPGDGTGDSIYPEIADQALKHGMLWSFAGGNFRSQHWQGQGVDQDGDGWIEFEGGNELLSWVDDNGDPRTFDSGRTIKAYLGWNDWTAVDQDYSVHLFRLVGGSRVEVAVADSTQDGQVGQYPVEYLTHTAETSGRYAVGVFRKQATGVHDLEIFTPRNKVVDPLVTRGSICNPADSPHALTVTAVQYSWPYSYFDYTSRGPANGPGGALSGGHILPELTSYADVDTASYGPSVFSGSSSAAPHAAGAAALAWSARPGWSGLEVRRLLERRARDLGPPGQDIDYGFGRLHLGDPPPPAGECVPEVHISDPDFPEEGGSSTVTVTVADGCPWFAATYADWVGVDTDGAESGVVSLTVAANTSLSTRSAELMVAGEVVTVTQDGHNPMPPPRRPSGRRTP